MNTIPPIPGPPFFLDHLLGLLFIAHIIFMNFTLAAPFIIGFKLLLHGDKTRDEMKLISAAHPVAYTFAINTGVSVLLFVQVLFTKQFFTANAIMGWAWLSIIALLLFSFYGSYLVKKLISGTRFSSRVIGLISIFVGLLIVDVGVAMVSNYFISTSSADWKTLLLDSSKVHSYSTFLPRLLHFVVGSFAVSGIWLCWLAWWKLRTDPENTSAKSLRQTGLRTAAASTALQIVVGIWFLLRLPTEMWQHLLSGNFISMVWIGGVVCGMLLLGILAIALLNPAKLIWQKIATAFLFMTLFGMVAGRELIRTKSFGESYTIKSLPSVDPGPVKPLFFTLLVLAILTIFYLLHLVRSAQPPKTENLTPRE